MSEKMKQMATRQARSLGIGSPLRVHLLAGLPTDAVRRGFEQAGHAMPVVPLDSLGNAVGGDAVRIGVLLPPFVEPSLVVESWEECDFLPGRFGRPARVEGVWAFVDVDHVRDQLASPDPLSLRGWGRGQHDRRTVADILVGQLESATRLVLVGDTTVSDWLARLLAVLNPGASVARPGHGSGLEASARGGGRPGQENARSDAPARSARVVPPWLAALRDEYDPAPGSDLLVYRRHQPFDMERLGEWLKNPPPDLIRGKGRVWLASDPARSYGYSCAGSVHRLFPTGGWWASSPDARWPSCASERRRLLERWHPRYGDRRQDLVFAGVDLDVDRLCAGLDACLEDSTDDAFDTPRGEGPEAPYPGSRLH